MPSTGNTTMQLLRHRRNGKKGSALIEIAMSYATLVIVAVITLKASVNATTGQTWTVKQSMSDAYITRESSLASRMPFETLAGSSSPWALSPNVSTSTVTIGKLPGGKTATATLYRTRVPDANNLTTAGGTGTATTNPGGAEAWKLQSILSYAVGDRTYVKSRTVLRIR